MIILVKKYSIIALLAFTILLQINPNHLVSADPMEGSSDKCTPDYKFFYYTGHAIGMRGNSHLKVQIKPHLGDFLERFAGDTDFNSGIGSNHSYNFSNTYVAIGYNITNHMAVILDLGSDSEYLEEQDRDISNRYKRYQVTSSFFPFPRWHLNLQLSSDEVKDVMRCYLGVGGGYSKFKLDAYDLSSNQLHTYDDNGSSPSTWIWMGRVYGGISVKLMEKISADLSITGTYHQGLNFSWNYTDTISLDGNKYEGSANLDGNSYISLGLNIKYLF